MKEIHEIVNKSNNYFRQKLQDLAKNGGMSKEKYVRYLRMQYHLTKGVQLPFLFIASHEKSRPYRKLREFLIRFAYEEEMHYKLAEKDLKRLKETPDEIPLDVLIWWSYYNHVIAERPFIRLGATAILENIGKGAGDIIKSMVKEASYLDGKNTTFLRIHLHEELPHGDQILDALNAERFKENDYTDLVKGSDIGFILFSRMLNWALKGESVI